MVKNSKSRKYNIISISIKLSILATLVIGILFVNVQVLDYIGFRNRSEVILTRNLIIAGVENAKQPAVIDAKTGDKYFPPEKLYLPYAPNLPSLTYSVEDNGSGGTEFRITSKFTTGEAFSKMYSAGNVEALLNKVPELQACSRGILLTYKLLSNDQIPSADNYNLNSSHVLKNGKTIYIYSEKEKVCTQLDELAEMLKKLQSY